MEQIFIVLLIGGWLLVFPLLGAIAFFRYRADRRRAEDQDALIRSMRTDLIILRETISPEKMRKLEGRLSSLEERYASGAPPAPAESLAVPAAPEPEEAPLQPEPAPPITPAAPTMPGIPAPAAAAFSAEIPPPPPVAGPVLAAGTTAGVAEKPPFIDLPRMPWAKSRDGAPFSFEMALGQKWLNWVGGLMVLVGVAYALKYAYDNSWIGPVGRLIIAAFWGAAALVAGERFRRKGWPILFQTLTGVGLAIFYLCTFFSFEVYKLTSQTTSFAVACGVTALAVALAVAHNAMSIAILAVIGGFLSPVLLSTGKNQPYALFTYIAILNLVAMGASYFRRWRPLELLCFFCTAFLFTAWLQRYFFADRANQLQPALIFSTVFYLMFLLIPMIHALVKRLPETQEGIALVVLNAVFTLAMYYRILYRDDRQLLGFFVVAEALLVFVLFRAWAARMGNLGVTSTSLLVIALALVTVAIPLHLKVYGVPIAWAVEGVLLTYIGIRFAYPGARAIGMIALFLAAGKLVNLMPLHLAYFVPVLNPAFGSWVLVSAACVLAAWLLTRKAFEVKHPLEPGYAPVAFVLGLVVLAGALTFEVSDFWSVRRGAVAHTHLHRNSSLIVLWSLLPALAAFALASRDRLKWPWYSLPVALLVPGLFLFLFGLLDSGWKSPVLFANAFFLPRVTYPATLFFAAYLWKKSEPGIKPALEIAANILLAILAASEVMRWSGASKIVDARVGLGLVSALWAFHAFLLVWFGLATKTSYRRKLGFGLFAVVIGKVFFVDTSELEKVYRILSFLASGLLIMAAGYFYHRYSAMLMREAAEEAAES